MPGHFALHGGGGVKNPCQGPCMNLKKNALKGMCNHEEGAVGRPAVELPGRKAMSKANAEFYCKPSHALNAQCPRATKANKP